MDEWTPTPEFEETVRQSFAVPALRTEFVDQVHADLMRRAAAKSKKQLGLFGLRPAWIATIAILSLAILATLVIGPQRVYAAVMQLFGYIPGVGIVDQSAPIRMLGEPVSVTRDGITVAVNRAVLTAAKTQLDYGISGVPLSAYPKGEAVTGCIEMEYLRLPDGAKVDLNAPIPANINEATFVLPCIFNTLPGTVPTGWELPLRFIPAPPDLTILPVIDVTQPPAPTANTAIVETGTPAPAATEPSRAVVSVEKIIETEDGYILLGAVRPSISEGSWLQVTGIANIRDADGKKVSYTFPNDVQPLDDSSLNQGGFGWVLQIKGAGVKFPLTISFSGVIISPVDPQASAELTVDVGPNPQPEQVWEVNQDVQLAGNTVRLLSLTANSDGYSFRIDPGANLSGVSVQIKDVQAVGGGGSSGGTGPRIFYTSLVYNELPKGQLTLVFTNPLSASPTETWQGQWQPATAREFPPSTDTVSACWNADTIQTIPTLPAGLVGSVVITQMNPQLQIVLTKMDGTHQQVLAQDSARAALSWDATHVAYSTSEGIEIRNLPNGEPILIAGSFGRELRWSPDGLRIAYVNSGDSNGIFVMDSSGKNQKQLSNLGYESLAGWSPDGTKLYYAIPGSSGNGFLLRSVDMNNGDTQDLFVLDNSSRKAPWAAISPDGQVIAYRASDNSSLYLKNMDGSPAHLLLDRPGTAINGIAWEKGGHLLGVSLITSENQDGEIILMAPDSCETYRMPGLSGELDGIILP